MSYSKYVRSALVFALIFMAFFAVIEYLPTGQFSVVSIAFHFVGGLLLGFVVGFVSSRLPFRNSIRIASLWLALFVIQYFANLVEYYFYSTVSLSGILPDLAEGLFVTLIEAVLIALLFVPVTRESAIGIEMKEFFEQRPGSSWVSRIVISSLVWIPIYFAFGMVVFPFIAPYYTDPSLGLSLTLPSFGIVIPLQFVRGLIYVLVLLPLIAALRIGRKYLFGVLTLVLYVPGAFIPLLTNVLWPVTLRMIHGIEVLGDFVVFAAVIVALLKKKEGSSP